MHWKLTKQIEKIKKKNYQNKRKQYRALSVYKKKNDTILLASENTRHKTIFPKLKAKWKTKLNMQTLNE